MEAMGHTPCVGDLLKAKKDVRMLEAVPEIEYDTLGVELTV